METYIISIQRCCYVGSDDCFRVVSPIDGFPMDGVMSLRVKSFNDLTRDSYTIRWTEVCQLTTSVSSNLHPLSYI